MAEKLEEEKEKLRQVGEEIKKHKVSSTQQFTRGGMPADRLGQDREAH